MDSLFDNYDQFMQVTTFELCKWLSIIHVFAFLYIILMYMCNVLWLVLMWIFYVYRYDRFIDAFEHVANMIDDIYKVCT